MIGWLNYNVECDWLIDRSDNNLASGFVESRSFPIEEIVIFMINMKNAFFASRHLPSGWFIHNNGKDDYQKNRKQHAKRDAHVSLCTRLSFFVTSLRNICHFVTPEKTNKRLKELIYTNELHLMASV